MQDTNITPWEIEIKIPFRTCSSMSVLYSTIKTIWVVFILNNTTLVELWKGVHQWNWHKFLLRYLYDFHCKFQGTSNKFEVGILLRMVWVEGCNEAKSQCLSMTLVWKKIIVFLFYKRFLVHQFFPEAIFFCFHPEALSPEATRAKIASLLEDAFSLVSPSTRNSLSPFSSPRSQVEPLSQVRLTLLCIIKISVHRFPLIKGLISTRTKVCFCLQKCYRGLLNSNAHFIVLSAFLVSIDVL